MKKLAVLAAAVAVAVSATAALSGNAGVKQAAREQAHAATLQQQVNELRNELVCLEALTANGLASDAYWAASAGSTPTAATPVDDRGVCKKLGVRGLGTTPDGTGAFGPSFRQLIVRATGH
jgi:hypothetical protein